MTSVLFEQRGNDSTKPTGGVVWATPVYGRSLVAVEACRVHLLEGLSRRAEGEDPGPASSVDKMLMVRAEQTLGGTEFDARAAGAVTGEDPVAANDYVYSRAASIYGGTEQIQKGIIATRILGLPR